MAITTIATKLLYKSSQQAVECVVNCHCTSNCTIVTIAVVNFYTVSWYTKCIPPALLTNQDCRHVQPIKKIRLVTLAIKTNNFLYGTKTDAAKTFTKELNYLLKFASLR